MKKFAIVILAISYLMLTVGVSLDLHHCKDNVYFAFYKGDSSCACKVDVISDKACNAFEPAEACCTHKPEEQHSPSCCYDESLTFKFSSEEQLPAKQLELSKVKVVQLLHTDYIEQEIESSFEALDYFELIESPPDEALWLQYKTLTYYG